MGAQKNENKPSAYPPGYHAVSPVPFLSIFKSGRVIYLASAAGASWAVTAVSVFGCSGADSVLDSC